VKVVFSPRYRLDLGGHVWPTEKYDLIRTRLLAERRAGPDDFLEPEPAPWEDLALVHSAGYLEKIRTNRLTREDEIRLELPFSPSVGEAFRLMTGGTQRAGRAALRDGLSVHLGGGLHHAFPDHGEGFCLFNDVAVSIRELQRDGRIRRAAVVDCDVHHGNGTAQIFGGDESVFTFSIHQQHNYPLLKPPSDLDIGLPDGTGDETYLHDLELALPDVLESRPDLVYYLAGADPYREDQLGGLAVSLEGLRHRDQMVLEATRSVPLAIVLAGGYAHRVEDTVEIHTTTVVEAMASAARRAGRA
jgi:acetoin utilization deacetylase AcuC-like enzyme